MSSLPPSAAGQPSITPASLARFAELVKKIGTSATPSIRKRKNVARKKLKRVIKEQRRLAKMAKLRAVALTLTYRSEKNFSPRHISAFLDRLRRALKRLGHRFSYAWALEIASHLHYHLILWLPHDYKLDLARLEKWWPWGSTWVESCRSVKDWGGYMAKFDSTSRLPKGARLYGYGGLDEAGKTAVARAGMPRWLILLLPTCHRARRRLGGGWVNSVTGEIYHSPYVWTPRGAIRAAISPPTCHME